jgi:hypothetical protein
MPTFSLLFVRGASSVVQTGKTPEILERSRGFQNADRADLDRFVSRGYCRHMAPPLTSPLHSLDGDCRHCQTNYVGIPGWSPCGHDGHLHVVQIIREGSAEKLLLECDVCNKNLIV